MMNDFSNILKGIKIVNIEGKDIKRGFSFFDKNNEFAVYKFKGNFDFSLGLIELDRLCKEKDIKLYEEFNNKLYSKILICVNFNYSNKKDIYEVEKVRKQKNNMKEQFKEVIKDNKNNAEAEISKLRAERDELLKQEKEKYKKRNIRKEYKVKIKNVRLNRDGTIKDTKINNKNEYKENSKKLDNSLTRNGIREELYENNFTVDGRVYRRFLRSSGSARVGKCLFILEDLYEDMMKYALAGNEVIEDMEIDLPSYEAYLGLVNTALEDVLLALKPENILLVDDVDSKPYTERCMVTKLVDDKLHTDVDNYEVSNSLFDGSSLIDFSLLEEKYCVAGGVQLRNKWFKGFATGCNITRFFEDHGITDISQLNGFTIATDIKDVKFITTKSSIKYLKANKGVKGFKKWLGIISPIWGICGHPHASKFVGGKYVQTHYQLLNNIQLSPEEVKEVAKESLEYANLLKNDLEVFKMHIGSQIQQKNENRNDEEYEDEFEKLDIEDSNNFMLTMVKMNSEFAKTKVFKDFRRETINNFIDNCKRGHLLVFGCYAVVISNSIDYLYHAIDKDWEATKEKSHMEHGSIMCDYFYKDYNKELLLSRSPMPVQGNILIAKNVDNKEIKEYFSYNNKISPFIVHVNAIESNYYERGSGYDNDGDKFLVTNHYCLLEHANKNYDKFLVPVNAVVSKEEIKYYWNNSSKAELDIKCSQNNIGRIINDSMILVSEYWHRINNGESNKNLLPLYKYISELSIMSNLAIDACKRPVPYEEEEELEKIENCVYFRDRETIQVKVKDSWTDKNGKKHNKTYKGHDGKSKQAYKKDSDGNYILEDKEAKVRPFFFKLVGQGQEYSFQNFDCSMDYLQKIMKVKCNNSLNTIRMGDLLSDYANGLKTGKAQKRDIDKLVGNNELEGIFQELDKKIKAIKATDNKKLSNIDKTKEMKDAREKVTEKLQSIRYGKGISDETIIAIIKRLDKDYSKKSGRLTEIGRIILVSLFNAYKDRFIKMFESGITEVEQLQRAKDGNIRIFNKNYKKQKVKFLGNEKAM